MIWAVSSIFVDLTLLTDKGGGGGPGGEDLFANSIVF